MTIHMGAMLLLVAAFGVVLMAAGAATIWWLIRDDPWFWGDALEDVGEHYIRPDVAPEEKSSRRDLAA